MRLDSSAPADLPSIGSPQNHNQSAATLSPEPEPPTPIVPPAFDSTAGVATTSHIAPPHPTQADRVILSSPDPAPADAPGCAPAQTAAAAAATDSTRTSAKMLFTDLYRSTKLPLSRLRQNGQSNSSHPEYDPDLVSRDKAKQKEAVRRYLVKHVRNDWVFKWPPEHKTSASDIVQPDASPERHPARHHEVSEEKPETDGAAAEADGYENDDASIYSTVSEDPTRFVTRTEWLSDLSDDEYEPVAPSAYRFEDPDAVGSTVKAVEAVRSAKRRKAMRAEMEWNDGLACFNARRDAWTGAKVARVRPKPAVPPTPTSPSSRRLSFWRLSNPTSPTSPTGTSSPTTQLSPSATRTSGDTTAVASSDNECKDAKGKQDSTAYPVETLLPKPPPLLPRANPMRASITPASYPSIYDKIVVQSMTPSCPVNLSDIIRACVAGWKRDGEWPPRPNEVPSVVAVRKKKRDSVVDANKPNSSRRMSFNLLGRRQSLGADANPADGASKKEEDPGPKGVRKSLQRVLGLGHEKTASSASNNGVAAG
ncbi:hypothetical protein F4780DRAFT_792562 [Xylariomycetidae sp. FL0641]|nr:hypothetical protein F4780DRAFT_792562 [Xylariomycetidae sp. FL0641]